MKSQTYSSGQVTTSKTKVTANKRSLLFFWHLPLKAIDINSIYKSFASQTQQKGRCNSMMKVVFTSLFLLFVTTATQAAIFTSVGNGAWGNTATWDRSGTPDVNNWPNDKVIINHVVTKSGNLVMNGSTSSITINNGGSLTVASTLNVGSGKVIVNSGGELSGNIIILNTSGTQVMNGTVTSTSTMEIDGHFTGSPTVVCGGNLLLGAQNMNQLFTALDMQVAGNMTVNNVKLTWTSGTVTVAGNFSLTGTGDVDVPDGGSLDASGTLSVSNLNSIDGPTGSGSGGIVSWGSGNVILSGNNKGLNNCPLPYASPFDLSTCSQAVASDVTAPVITLIGNATENVTFGDTYTDAGATATDDTDGNLTSSIATTSNVDVNTVGSYTVTYNVSDAAGNAATAVVRTVNINDVTEPVITLIGNATETVSVGATYTDAGATATDDTDGDLTSSIATTNNVDVNTVGSYTVTYNVSDAAGNTATQIVRTVNVVIPTRTSIASGSFNDASTWDCNCVPSSGDDVVIAHDLNLTDPFTVNAENTFTINSGITLTFATYLNIAGQFTNSGTLSGGDLRFTGTSAQTPTIGSNLQTLTIDNSSGVTLSSDLDITSGIVLTDGQLNLGGNALTLKASSTSTAYISETCVGTSSISGAVTVEQYVPEAGFGHHYLSSPMSGLALSEWSDDFDFKLGDVTFPHLYYYDEPNSQWVTPSAATDAMVVGRGYTGYFSGEIIVDATGVPNTGDITIPLTNDGDGWNLIGNPFPSPIDWDNVTIPSGVAGAFYAWDHIPAIWGRYATYLDGIGTNGGTNVVPMMQGFFMSSTVNTNIVFYCEDRINTDNPGVFYRKTTATDPLIRLQAGGFGYTTDAVVRFKTDATEGYDETVDALLFPSGDPKGLDFGTLSSDDRRLVINTVSLEMMNTKIPVYVKINTEGSYEIEMTDIKNFSSTVGVLLHDDQLGIVHSLIDGPYAFHSEVTLGEGRFYVEATDVTLGTNPTSISNGFAWAVKSGQVTVTFGAPLVQNHKLEVCSVVGQIVHVQLLENGSNIFTIPAGALNNHETYLVKILDTGNTFKLFLQ